MSRKVLHARSAVLVGVEGRLLPIVIHLDSPCTDQQHADDAVVHRALAAAGFGCERHFVSQVPHAVGREDSSVNLTIALRLLSAEGRIPRGALTNFVAVGSLAPTGHIRPVRGTYPILRTLKRDGIEKVLVPRAAAVEAGWVEGIHVLTADSLAGAVRVLSSGARVTATRPTSLNAPSNPIQEWTTEWPVTPSIAHAFDIAAAGGHHVLLVGAHDSPTAWLARQFVNLLPPPSLEEAFDITAHHIAANTPTPRAIVTARPVMAPPPSISASGLAGGGQAQFRPGELTLAHHGILILEDVAYFAPATLAATACTLARGEVRLQWGGEQISVPARPQVIATMTACPCGRLGHPDRHCPCTMTQLAQHHARIPPSLREVFAMTLPIPVSVRPEEMHRVPGLQSRRETVAAARGMRRARGPDHDPFRRLTSRAHAYDQMLVTDCAVRPVVRTHLVRIAATIADLRGDDRITDTDLRLAKHFVDPGGPIY